MGNGAVTCCIWVACCIELASVVSGESPDFERQIRPVFKKHCVKCHGPSKREGKLDLSLPRAIARGNPSGAVIVPHDLENSRLWKLIDADEMPPETPLSPEEKSLIRNWIVSGAPGVQERSNLSLAEQAHWAFQTIQAPNIPSVENPDGLVNEVDHFLQAARETTSILANSEADRRTLIRRACMDLVGRPPTIEETSTFLNDDSPEAYTRMIDRYLASPQYGVRWGKYWLDVVGYADSNGYFSADSDRPLAYRYRDYVVHSFNQDKSFDRFVVEQIAGDELADFHPDRPATSQSIELLEATHFLRNGQDGSGESDGNPDEVRADRFYALESAMQISASALLGLTIQCAKCHDHKFEPISQRDYYRWQAIFYPTFHIERWVKPNDRFIFAPLAHEQQRWEGKTREADERVAQLRQELARWQAVNRVRGEILFEDRFESQEVVLSERWSNTAPGDDSPGGKVAVKLDGRESPSSLSGIVIEGPSARIKNGQLQIVEKGTIGDSWISTRNSFDWTPDQIGESIQATFDLVDNKLESKGNAASRIGYFIALHDFNDNSSTAGGNLLIDGNPQSSTALHLDYPGPDSRALGSLGTTGYVTGQNYGIRVTNRGEGKYRLEQLVNSFPDEQPIDVNASDLPDGGFGFEYCCGRSFVVDNVLIERLPAQRSEGSQLAEWKLKRDELSKAVARQKEIAAERPGKIAWAGDMANELPEVHLLERGNYASLGVVVQPGTLSVLDDKNRPFEVASEQRQERSTGRRLAWATWLTRPGTPAASLLARVQVNRLWQLHFGTGIVATSENLGLSGAPPSHCELLDWLAHKLTESQWSIKTLHRILLNSAAYRRSSLFSQAAHAVDPDNRYLWRYQPRRLDAEAIRDSLLAVSGELNSKMGGPYVPTKRNDAGEVVASDESGGLRRSLYLYQRRTQVASFLTVFDAPSIVFNSTRRNTSTMPLQSLTLMNSAFVIQRAQDVANRVRLLESDESRRLETVFQLLYTRLPSREEATELMEFLERQTQYYAESGDPRQRAWIDLCQGLLASSEFLYVD